VIGLLMENKAKYMAYIIGLAKIGVTVALINFHLKEEVRKTISAFETEIRYIK
jgi:acyl-CoA synthetase (AMP-forming)/AMP-acid ligase II